MTSPEKLIKLIDEVNPGNYEIVVGEIIALANQFENSRCDLICAAFKYGFLKGQRAEKAKARKRRATA